MAEKKLSPRQRMINMMYLVLLALLALNVDRHVLNSFHHMEQNFMQSSLNYDQRNNDQMTLFQQMLKDDEVKAKPYYEAALKAQTLSTDLTDYLESVKQEVETLYNGREEADDGESIGPLKTPEQMEKHANFFITKDRGKRAKELQDRINQTRDELLSLLLPGIDSLFIDDATYNRVRMSNLLNADDPESKGIDNKTWASMNLEYQPAGALMALITQYQNYTKALEADVIRSLMTGVNAFSFSIDQLDAMIVPRSNYVMAGEDYTADVMLVATNSTTQPTIRLNGDILDSVSNGVGKVRIRASGVGVHEVTGTIEVMDPKDRTTKEYTYQHEYQVFQPMATVSAEQMKLVYVGLNNPLSISVPGYSAADISVTCSNGGRISGSNGQYKLNVDGSQRKVKVFVSAKGRPMGTTEFRVRDVPAPRIQLGGISNFSRALSPPQLCVQQQIFASLGAEFAYDLHWRVLHYRVILQPKNRPAVSEDVTGSAITSRVKQMMCNAQRGDRIFIENVKAVERDYGLERRLDPIVINIR